MLQTTLQKTATKLTLFCDMYKSTEKKIQLIRQLVQEHYEPGRQDRCKLWVYRTIIRPRFGISERTFFRCLSTRRDTKDDNQLSLF